MEDELLIKFLLRETNAEENSAVNEWLQSTAENPVYLASLERIWAESRNLLSKREVDIDAAWLKFKNKANTVKPNATIRLKPINSLARIAAVFVLAIGSWALYTIFKTQGYTDVKTNLQVRSQLLPDGSEITLNKFSHIEYANNFKNKRNIKLESGDVFFEVAKDKAKPFIIEIDKVTVEVVGTSFNIKHLKGLTEVVVETGIVKVSLGNATVLLHKGEKLVLEKGVNKLAKLPVNDELYNYYRSKLFIADQTPLPILVAILNEAYGGNVVVTGAAKELTITTTLPYEKSLDENLRTIIKTFDNLKLKRNQNEIILSY
ncbi:FecR family protein [Pedobacter insulae]|uniref:Ferric-dicitrate binding protein FerR, regulates iron transport through sigma-19 n=1 Tax=Pedobacter insulae TaxID=414048 RepID=A0A1I2WIX1_9SPHI|nr:FecR family protein [Pedobacter insulae]SFH01194.1 ferric-dicitrate binding protein FerR, regulates iron transport through sigma-19 [Pedobacter insulae]